VAKHVGRQFVHGQDHIRDPVLRQSRLTGTSPHFGAQNVQRASVECQIKERRDVAASRLAPNAAVEEIAEMLERKR